MGWVIPIQKISVVLFVSFFLLKSNQDHEETGSVFEDQLGIHCCLKEFAKIHFKHSSKKTFMPFRL